MAKPKPAMVDVNLPAIVVDANNGNVLYANRADEVRAPASITKVMTLYLVFDALQSGRVNWNTQLPVSRNAASRPRMKLDVPAGSTISLRDAVNALVVVSANDAAVVVAEYLAGSEQKFAQLMTLKARSLGMRNTTFKNANGLPASGHVSSARDIALMSIALREHFPQYYNLFSMRQFSYQGRVIKGHNRVLDRIDGADGLKTGFTNAAGFTITTSVARGGKKIVVVVLGGATTRQRDDKVVALADAYFDKASRFSKKQIFPSWSVAQSVFRAGSSPNTSTNIASAQAAAQVASLDQYPPAPKARTQNAQQKQAQIKQQNTAKSQTVERAIAQASAADAPQRQSKQMVAQTTPAPRPNGKKAYKASPDGLAPSAMAFTNDNTNQATAALSGQINSNYVVEVAAMSDKKTAHGFLKSIQSALGAGKAASYGYVDQARLEAKTVYRVRFGAFNDEAAANDVCNMITRKAYSCYVVSSQ